jgi:hypothetical protein
MKWVIRILVLTGVLALFSCATGVNSARYLDPGWRIGHLSPSGRILCGILGVLNLTAAYGCVKRKVYGWYIVYVALWLSMLWAIYRAIYLGFSLHLDWLGLLLGGLGEAFKVGIWAWLIFKFWSGKRAEFKNV